METLTSQTLGETTREMILTNLRCEMDNANCELTKLARKNLRYPTPENHKAMTEQYKKSLKAYRAYWNAVDGK